MSSQMSQIDEEEATKRSELERKLKVGSRARRAIDR
jgi:hypothetical protein